MRSEYTFEAERFERIRHVLGYSEKEAAAQRALEDASGFAKVKASINKMGATDSHFRDLMNAQLPSSQPVGPVVRRVHDDSERAFKVEFVASVPVGACLDLILFNYKSRYRSTVTALGRGDSTQVIVETRTDGPGPGCALAIGVLLIFLIAPFFWALLMLWADAKYKKLFHQRAMLPMLQSLGVLD